MWRFNFDEFIFISGLNHKEDLLKEMTEEDHLVDAQKLLPENVGKIILLNVHLLLPIEKIILILTNLLNLFMMLMNGV
jgi:hypothetical protein